MVWAVGTVEDAIRISKTTKNVLFFLFEDGSEHGSMNLLRNPNIALFLESPLLVGVRVLTSSELFVQFSAIYHFIPTPCLVFLRHDGQPIDIIADNVAVDEACSRIQECMNYASSTRNPPVAASTAPSGPSRVENAAHIQNDFTRNPASSRNTVDADKFSQSVGAPKRSNVNTDTINLGQNTVIPVYTVRNPGNDPAEISYEEEINSSIRPTTAHVQFRLPTGETHTHLFSNNATVMDLFKYVENNLALPTGRWSLSLSYPRRELSLTEGLKTVFEVGLVPNGVILVIPASGEVSRPRFLHLAGNLMYSIISTPIVVVNSVCSYIYSLIFGSPAVVNESPREEEPIPSTSTQPASRIVINPAIRRRTMPSTSVMREGNIHRFTYRQDDSDDDNNTWNGNSTQQM